MYKQVIVVRTDVAMSCAKLAVQIAHASVSAYRGASKEAQDAWFDPDNGNQRKIALKVDSAEKLLEIARAAKNHGLPTEIIYDAGYTELPPNTLTAVGIGPAESAEIDLITGKLSLLKRS